MYFYLVSTDPGMVPRYYGPQRSRFLCQEEERKEGQERQEVGQEKEEIDFIVNV